MKDLKALRAAAGLPASALAKKAGVDTSLILHVEAYRSGLTDHVAKAIAPALGVKAQDLQQAQTLAGFKHQAEKLEHLGPEALKRAVIKDSGKAAAAVLALTEIIKDEYLPLELRQQASKTVSRLLDLIDKPEPEAQKSRPDPSRDLHGRKRPGEKITRDAVGRAVK